MTTTTKAKLFTAAEDELALQARALAKKKLAERGNIPPGQGPYVKLSAIYGRTPRAWSRRGYVLAKRGERADA